MQIAFYVLLAILLLMVGLFTYHMFFFDKVHAKNNIKINGKKLTHIATVKDYLLLNKLKLQISTDKNLEIDHLLFGNKYIYLFMDLYFKDGLSGKENDQSWVEISTHHKYIDNPIFLLNKKVDDLSLLTRLDRSMIIPIILINDACALGDIEIKTKDLYVIKLNKLDKLLDTLESRDIGSLKENQLEQTAADINRLNLNKKA